MEEKIEMKNMHRLTLENQIKQDTANLKKLTDIIPDVEKSIKIAKKLLEIDDSVGKIILEKFKKTHADYEYENDERFENLMLQKQKLLNERNHLNAISSIRDMEQKLLDSKDRVEYYKTTLKMREEELKKTGE